MVEWSRTSIQWLERISRAVAVGCLLAVMLIVVSDVGARYLFNAPMIWTYDVIGMYLMPALFYLSVSDTLADNHHIAVDLLRPRMPMTLIRISELLGCLAMAAVFLGIAWIYGGSGIEKFRTGAVVMSSHQWPSWIPDAIVTIGSLTISLRLIGLFIGHTLSLLLGRSIVDVPASVEH